jgi:methyltransferase family protein
MTATDTYATRIDAVSAQRLRIHGHQPQEDRFGGPEAQRFRCDPHRSLDANLQVIASYVQPDDVLIDVGGGAGRGGLPLALRCRQVINVDASPGMLAEFEACAAEAGITNARAILSDWLTAADIAGDVSLASSVTYFVRDIVPFIEKMVAASRRRVIITPWSVPTPNQNAPLFRLVYGEEQAPVPGHRELLPVLWEMGVLPDVCVLPDAPRLPRSAIAGQDSTDAPGGRILGVAGPVAAAGRPGTGPGDLVEAHFHELFAQRPEGFCPLWHQEARQLLITWETGKRR